MLSKWGRGERWGELGVGMAEGEGGNGDQREWSGDRQRNSYFKLVKN